MATLNRNAYKQEFRSLGEFVEFADAQTITGYGNPKTTEDREFTGTRTWAEAVEESHKWDRGTKQVADLKASILKNTQSARKVTVRREVGPGTLSMGHYLQGHPKAYLSKVPTADIKRAGRGKIVHVIVNGSASCGVAASIIRTRGAAVASLVSSLERAGKRVQVDVVFPVNGGFGSTAGVVTYVRVKAAAAPLNLNTLTFAVAHPSALRRFAFAVWHDPNFPRRSEITENGYGYPCDLAEQDIPKGAIYLATMRGYEQEWASPAQAAAWVAAQAAEQGIRLG